MNKCENCVYDISVQVEINFFLVFHSEKMSKIFERGS